jgi:hypothetical protein
VFVFWTLTDWLAAAAAGRQASKQLLTEGRKEALLGCLLVRQSLSTGKLVTPVAATVKMACLPNLGCAKKMVGSVVGVSRWGVCPQESTTVL